MSDDKADQTGQAGLDAELERAVAAHDAEESGWHARPQPALKMFERENWQDSYLMGGALVIAALLVLAAMGIGGAPWTSDFWLALVVLLAVLSPVAASALFLWKRDR